jgi:hypothetical protein
MSQKFRGGREVWQMPAAVEEVEPCIGNMPGDVVRRSHRDPTIFRPVHDERGRLHLRENRGDVNLRVRAHVFGMLCRGRRRRLRVNCSASSPVSGSAI